MKRLDALAPDPLAVPLQAMRSAVETLRRAVETDEQLSDLDLIDDAIARLSRPRSTGAGGLAEFDPSRLSHLLDLTGPDLGPELLARLTEDLTATEERLAQGAAGADWKLLREGSHVLISLAGSVGALSLQAMAESLNAVAHGQDRATLATLMPPLSAELAILIQIIRATRSPNGNAR